MVYSPPGLNASVLLRLVPKSPLLRGFLCAALFAASILALIPVHYATNDDISLLWVLKGADGYPPDAFALYNSLFLNTALFGLYKVAPAFPWWGIVIYTALTFATTLLFSVLFRVGKPSLIVLPALFFFLAHSFALSGITNATVLLELACLLCLCEAALRGGMPTRHPRLYGLALATGLTGAFLMRWEVALFLSVLGLPALVLARAGLRGKIAAVLLLAAGALAADRMLFSLSTSPSEQAFIRYNALRASFQDTPAGALHPGTETRSLAAAGWSRADYDFFKGWVLYDDSLFNAKRLQAFLGQNSLGAGDLSGPREFISRFLGNLGDHKKHLVMWGLSLAAACVLMGRRRRMASPSSFSSFSIRIRRLYAPWLPFAVGLLALGFFAYYRFVERIYIPLFVFTLAAFLLAAEHFQRGEPGLKTTGSNWILNWKIWAGVQACFALGLAADRVQALREDQHELRFVSECLEKRVRKVPGTTWIFLDPASGLGLENVHPLRERVSAVPMRFFPDGFWIHAPRYQGILAEMGRTNSRDFLRRAAGDETFSWVLVKKSGSPSSPWILRDWEGYYRRNLDLSVRFVQTSACPSPEGGSLAFYKMTRAPID